MKKYLACLTAAFMMSAAFTACGGSSESASTESNANPDVVQEAPETSPVAANGDADASAAEADAAPADAAPADAASADSAADSAQEVTQVQDVEFEPANSAKPGQAYLAIVDGQWWIQYWGSAEKDGYMLSYNAGIADIQGDGSYTVSVTADTNGFRYDTTGDPADQYVPEGLSFMSVMIPDGETLYPGAVITIDSITVDGKELELTAKNYTSSDDGAETRSNIYNSYVSAPSDDARTAEGNLYDADGNAVDNIKEYSAQIIDPAEFATWTTVEVNFTITGTDGSNAPAADAGDDAGAADDAAGDDAGDDE